MNKLDKIIATHGFDDYMVLGCDSALFRRRGIPSCIETARGSAMEYYGRARPSRDRDPLSGRGLPRVLRRSRELPPPSGPRRVPQPRDAFFEAIGEEASSYVGTRLIEAISASSSLRRGCASTPDA